MAYIKDPSAFVKAFDVSAVPRISREQAAKETARAYMLVSVLTDKWAKLYLGD